MVVARNFTARLFEPSQRRNNADMAWTLSKRDTAPARHDWALFVLVITCHHKVAETDEAYVNHRCCTMDVVRLMRQSRDHIVGVVPRSDRTYRRRASFALLTQHTC
ncbi:hypothetical protein LSAT2_027394 [Lamellibrachia satsuma]|nr:hypothetical protein LSAT2_027394 [Lamellibrachia satsuma]